VAVTSEGSEDERVDVVVVGARCAGSAAATAFARAGRSVVALDAARFPSTTISTHLLWPGGVAELERLGARERVERIGSPRMPIGTAALPSGEEIRGTYTPVDGIDYALCVRRRPLDAELVATARESGADVREQTRVTDLLWRDGRVVGVRARRRDGTVGELHASLVVGADGRRSTVARLVGSSDPHLANPNQRACYYAYYEDATDIYRPVAAQWRAGAELGTAFPCDGGLVLVLLMPPVERVPAFAADKEAEYDRTVAGLDGLADRLKGCRRVSKVVSATDHPSYFRRSSGPGWALPGDAGHFKDPITAQGIRDALRFGRVLGEMAAPVLDDPVQLDAALDAWERHRDDECLETYHWTNRVARSDEVGPLDVASYRFFAHPDRCHELLDVHSRILRPAEVFTTRRAARLALQALLLPGTDRRSTIARIAREFRG
jgi:menaquinone-9 beta-reductase